MGSLGGRSSKSAHAEVSGKAAPVGNARIANWPVAGLFQYSGDRRWWVSPLSREKWDGCLVRQIADALNEPRVVPARAA